MAVSPQPFASTRAELARLPHPPVAMRIDNRDLYRHSCPNGCAYEYLSADPFSQGDPDHACP